MLSRNHIGSNYGPRHTLPKGGVQQAPHRGAFSAGRCSTTSTDGSQLNKEIAHYLHDHKDIATFNSICKETSDAIVGDNLSFWRTKFCEDFARPPNKTNVQLRSIYMERWRWLRRFVNMKTVPQFQFVRGHTAKEKAVVRVLIDLINESFAGAQPGDRRNCLNMLRLKEFVLESRLLLGGRRPPPPKPHEHAAINVSLGAVRLMATHFLFDRAFQPEIWFAIDDAQRAVYAATNEAPLYLGPKKDILNVQWVLHCLNFFRYYMTVPEASDLHEAIQELDKSQRPSPWDGPLKSGTYALGNHWKGTYAFLQHKDLERFRRLVLQEMYTDRIFTDLNVDEGKIQVSMVASLEWPQLICTLSLSTSTS